VKRFSAGREVVSEGIDERGHDAGAVLGDQRLKGNHLSNFRLKLAACGTLARGTHRRRSHAAA